jgi:hypothetical protein
MPAGAVLVGKPGGEGGNRRVLDAPAGQADQAPDVSAVKDPDHPASSLETRPALH